MKLTRLALAVSLAGLVATAACSSSTTTTDPGNEAAGKCDTSPLPPVCIGATAPTWKLKDFQPKSDDNGKTYGLEAFKGKVVLVAFFAGWCGYCQSQAVKLQAMLDELKATNHPDVVFVSVNSIDADTPAYHDNLIQRCGFPLFQDTADAKVWLSMKGAKDDFYIYGKDGKLFRYLNSGGVTNTNLSSDGYENVKRLILEAGG